MAAAILFEAQLEAQRDVEVVLRHICKATCVERNSTSPAVRVWDLRLLPETQTFDDGVLPEVEMPQQPQITTFFVLPAFPA